MANEGTVALNNYLQSIGQLELLSWENKSSGPRHAPTWTCTCKLSGRPIGVGEGLQMHVAKNHAAEAALAVLTAAGNEAANEVAHEAANEATDEAENGAATE